MMANGEEQTRHDSGVDTDSDGSTTMSVGSPLHRNHFPPANQIDEGIIDAPSVPDLPPQEVRVLEIPQPQQMDMCPLAHEEPGPSAPVEAKAHMALKHAPLDGVKQSGSAQVFPQFKLNEDNNAWNHSASLVKTDRKNSAMQERCGGKELSTGRSQRMRKKALRVYPTKAPRKSDDNALREAASINNMERCEELLKKGARVTSGDFRGRTALHFAATLRAGAPLVKLLLRYGADPNAQDIAGNTPMHLAICINNAPVIQELLKHGSDLTAVDRSGRNPFQLARSRLRLILAETANGTWPEVSLRLRRETLKMVSALLEYAEQRKDKVACALLLSSFQERFLVSKSSNQFNADVSDLLSSLENLQLL